MSAFWAGRRVLVTGDAGFKGTWLCLWLKEMGAEVTGFSLPDNDVRDAGAVAAAVTSARPDVLIHMAAQPLVRASYAAPVETYDTNVMGTVNVLEAAREVPVVVNVTTDKVYEDRGSQTGYREDDPLGAADPYATSKAMSELVTAAFRRSYGMRAATARAGNVIGGGDFATDRLVPDAVRAVVAGEPLRIRNPDAVRPWQHVLNPLSGYLLLAERLWDDPEAAEAWNFGPPAADCRPVREVVDRLAELFDGELRWEQDPGEHPHETHELRLDSTKARERLGWEPAWDLDRALESIVEWTRAWRSGEDPAEATLTQIRGFSPAR